MLNPNDTQALVTELENVSCDVEEALDKAKILHTDACEPVDCRDHALLVYTVLDGTKILGPFSYAEGHEARDRINKAISTTGRAAFLFSLTSEADLWVTTKVKE